MRVKNHCKNRELIRACKLAGSKIMFPIIAEMFNEYKIYAEPFCGTASILLNKMPSGTEYLSDIDGTLVEYLKAIRDCPDRVVNELIQHEFDKEDFDNSMKIGVNSRDGFKQATAFGVSSISSFDNNNINFRKNKAEERKDIYIDYYVKNIFRASQRLQGVNITKCDYTETLQKFICNEEAAIYLDPPHNKRKIGQSTGFDRKDTINFIERIKDSRAFVVITAPRLKGNPYDIILGKLGNWYCYYIGEHIDYASAVDNSRAKKGMTNMWCWTNRILPPYISGRLSYSLPITSSEFYELVREDDDITKKKYYN